MGGLKILAAYTAVSLGAFKVAAPFVHSDNKKKKHDSVSQKSSGIVKVASSKIQSR